MKHTLKVNEVIKSVTDKYVYTVETVKYEEVHFFIMPKWIDGTFGTAYKSYAEAARNVNLYCQRAYRAYNGITPDEVEVRACVNVRMKCVHHRYAR